MKSLPERIMGYADAKLEVTPLQAEDLVHFGESSHPEAGALAP